MLDLLVSGPEVVHPRADWDYWRCSLTRETEAEQCWEKLCKLDLSVSGCLLFNRMKGRNGTRETASLEPCWSGQRTIEDLGKPWVSPQFPTVFYLFTTSSWDFWGLPAFLYGRRRGPSVPPKYSALPQITLLVDLGGVLLTFLDRQPPNHDTDFYQLWELALV